MWSILLVWAQCPLLYSHSLVMWPYYMCLLCLQSTVMFYFCKILIPLSFTCCSEEWNMLYHIFEKIRRFCITIYKTQVFVLHNSFIEAAQFVPLSHKPYSVIHLWSLIITTSATSAVSGILILWPIILQWWRTPTLQITSLVMITLISPICIGSFLIP